MLPSFKRPHPRMGGAISGQHSWTSLRLTAAWIIHGSSGVPRAEALWYIRETRRSTLHPSHGPWTAGEVPPERGLKKGCSCSPMLFRCCVQDVVKELSASWKEHGLGIPIAGAEWVTHLIWADDTWITPQSPEALAVTITELQDAMSKSIGLSLHPEKCTVARIGPDSHVPAFDQLPPVLQEMTRATGTTCLRVLGDSVQLDPGHLEEWEHKRKNAWRGHHARKAFWGPRGHEPNKLRMLHMATCLVVSWCSGFRAWTLDQLRSARTMLLRTPRGALQLWTHADDSWQDTRHIDIIEAYAKAPRWDVALATSWWRFAGHMVRLSKSSFQRLLTTLLP